MAYKALKGCTVVFKVVISELHYRYMYTGRVRKITDYFPSDYRLQVIKRDYFTKTQITDYLFDTCRLQKTVYKTSLLFEITYYLFDKFRLQIIQHTQITDYRLLA